MNLIRRIVCLGMMLFLGFAVNAVAQGGNSISGHVFGTQRQPLERITVELQDEFSRTLFRVETSSSGRYFFTGMPSGVFRVKVLPYGTNYREAEVTIEIQNVMRTRSDGTASPGAFANEQRDFYLRIDRDKQPTSEGETATVFVQEVPTEAKALYDSGVDLLAKEKSTEGNKKLIAAIEAFPDYFMAIERLGLEYVNSGHFRPASVLLLRAVAINAKSFKGWYGLAFSYSSLGMNDEALGAADKAAEIAPRSADALFLRGSLLRKTAKYSESEKELEHAKKLAKNTNPKIHWELALLYGNNLKRYGDAADELEAFLKLQPGSKDAEKIKSLIKTFRQKSKS